MMKPSIHETEERIAYIKGRIKDMHESIGKAYVEGREDHIPYFQMHLNAWQDELRELEESKDERKPFAVFQTKEEYDEHCERMMTAGVDDAMQKVIDEVKAVLDYYWRTEKLLRASGDSINMLNTKIHVALGAYKNIFKAFGYELEWGVDWKDSESRVYEACGRRLDSPSLIFSVHNFGKDEWWQ